MATIKFLLGIICLNLTIGTTMFRRNLLSDHLRMGSSVQKRGLLVQLAEAEIGVRELTGHNDGKEIARYQRYVDIRSGDPYCAAYVSYIYSKAGYARPRSGWCPDMFPVSRLARSALPGDILGIYFAEVRRIAHVGLILEQKGHWVESVEANTNVAGSREGDGVYRKIRHIRTISKIADWTEGSIIE